MLAEDLKIGDIILVEGGSSNYNIEILDISSLILNIDILIYLKLIIGQTFLRLIKLLKYLKY